MIKLTIKAKDRKVASQFEDELVTMNEVAILLYEFDRLKREIMDKYEFQSDFSLQEEK